MHRNKMVGFTWIKTTLFLILLLQAGAVTGQVSSVTVRDGDDVTLPCKNVINYQDRCAGTTWIYSDTPSSQVVELVKLGQIDEGAKVKSDRLSVTADCSLLIKKVKVQDAGLYSCRQYDRSGQQQGSDAQVHLSVININELKDGDVVTLSCTVLTYNCGTVYGRHTVEWLYEGNKNESTDLKKSKGSCEATVTFTASDLIQKELFKCKVTDSNNGTLLCSLTPQSSCEKHTRGNKDPTEPPGLEWWWFIVVAVGLAALLIIVVVVVRWKKTKGNKTQTDDSNVDPEDGVSYASVSFTKKTSGEARVQGNTDDECYEVTYSTMKASSSSVGASTDPSDLYATINKPNKKEATT